MHPRNIHKSGYDFKELIKCCPELKTHVILTKYGTQSIDFSHPQAVRLLNKAILSSFYNIKHWSIPPQFLCPPIPGRADYIHYVADLLGDLHRPARGLDIGVGANCVYPLIGQSSYGWSFVGSDIDPLAITNAKFIIQSNNLGNAIEIRQQFSTDMIFDSIIKENETFDFTMCNPPFHGSSEEAARGTKRKWKSLGKESETNLNFGGKSNELWCEGGERSFIMKMIKESHRFSAHCLWFTSLVSKETTLPILIKDLKQYEISEYKIIDMTQGQKKSRLLAWTYFSPHDQQQWKKRQT